ncbi:MAG: hypothetical protein P1P64_00955 [Treponemataceae bacterium]
MKKVFLIVFAFLFCRIFAETKKGVNLDFYTSMSVGKNSFSELVFSDSKLCSDLVWVQKPTLAINVGLELNLKRGFYCFAEFSYIPKNLPTKFTDSDFTNGKIFLYSEHPAKTENSFAGFMGFGWKFTRRNERCKIFCKPRN